MPIPYQDPGFRLREPGSWSAGDRQARRTMLADIILKRCSRNGWDESQRGYDRHGILVKRLLRRLTGIAYDCSQANHYYPRKDCYRRRP